MGRWDYIENILTMVISAALVGFLCWWFNSWLGLLGLLLMLNINFASRPN